jgi:3-deoxy-D-manno-octulosonic-acid transferase
MPVLFGPHMQNFLAAGDVLLTTGAARRVVSAADLAQALSLLVEDSAQRAAMARAGQDVVNRNRGSLQRLLHQIFAC